jgi:ABC-type sugar transport system permease subunit
MDLLKMIRRTRLVTCLYVLAILVVVCIAGGLRWRAVNMLPIDYDEDDYLRAAQQYAGLIRSGDWKGFLETNYRPEHPPLAKIIFGISILPLPEEPLVPDLSSNADPAKSLPGDQLHYTRVASAVFGTAESLLLAVVNPLAGLFLAVHTFTIKYTSQVMLEAFPAFTCMVSVLSYVQYKHKKDKQPKSKGINRWLIASAVFLGLTASSKYIYCVVGIAILIDWFLTAKKSSSIERFIPLLILWGVIALGVFFITDPFLWPSPIERLKESILFNASYSQSAHVRETGWPLWQPLVWLAQSCPWHPGVFIVSIDLLISLLAITGLSRLWVKERVYGLWLGTAIVFLLIWPTKWPQYILILTAPLSLAAAEGFKGLVVEPVISIWHKIRARQKVPRISLREMIKATPWLLPGIIALTILILYPLIYQLAMSVTDFSGPSIRDGIQGGIWRAAWEGLTGQIKAANWDPFSQQFNFSQTVHYIGPDLIKNVFLGSPDLLVFELLWTVLSVSLQAVLGIGLALLLNQRGVRFPNFWRTIFLLPWAIPEFVGALIWLRTFDPTVGWVSQAAGTSGGSGGAVLISKLINAGGPNLSMLLLLFAATWIGFPFVMLAASASLKLIPEEVYDAAAIDGAGTWSRFRFVTWPMLLPLVVPVIIIRAIFSFNQFYLLYVFFPHPQFNGFGTFAYFSYLYFKEGSLYSISAAINVITVVVLIILLMLFNRWSKALEGVTYA